MSTEMSEDVIRLREELSEQYRSLQDLKRIRSKYGFDISRPATNFKEAVQWLYLAFSCYQRTKWCSNEFRTYFNILRYLC